MLLPLLSAAAAPPILVVYRFSNKLPSHRKNLPFGVARAGGRTISAAAARTPTTRQYWSLVCFRQLLCPSAFVRPSIRLSRAASEYSDRPTDPQDDRYISRLLGHSTKLAKFSESNHWSTWRIVGEGWRDDDIDEDDGTATAGIETDLDALWLPWFVEPNACRATRRKLNSTQLPGGLSWVEARRVVGYAMGLSHVRPNVNGTESQNVTFNIYIRHLGLTPKWNVRVHLQNRADQSDWQWSVLNHWNRWALI